MMDEATMKKMLAKATDVMHAAATGKAGAVLASTTPAEGGAMVDVSVWGNVSVLHAVALAHALLIVAGKGINADCRCDRCAKMRFGIDSAMRQLADNFFRKAVDLRDRPHVH